MPGSKHPVQLVLGINYTLHAYKIQMILCLDAQNVFKYKKRGYAECMQYTLCTGAQLCI